MVTWVIKLTRLVFYILTLCSFQFNAKMMSFPLLCLLVLAFAIVDDSSVSAKQICHCKARRYGSKDFEEKATKSCEPPFYCYDYAFVYNCEVKPEWRQQFHDCCNDFDNKQFNGIKCKEKPDV